MTEARKKKSHAPWWLLGISLLSNVFLFFNRDSNSQKMTIPTPLGDMVIEAEDGEINPAKFLDSLYSDDYTRGGLMQWLANKNIYRVDDPELAQALTSQVCKTFPTHDLDARLRSEKECAEKSGVKELRQLASEREVPFHRVGKIIEIGIPGSIQEAGRAYACYDSDYLGKRVLIINQGNHMQQVQVEIDHKGRYSCKPSSAPDIQLSKEDALAVSDPFYGPKEKAIVIVAE